QHHRGDHRDDWPVEQWPTGDSDQDRHARSPDRADSNRGRGGHRHDSDLMNRVDARQLVERKRLVLRALRLDARLGDARGAAHVVDTHPELPRDVALREVHAPGWHVRVLPSTRWVDFWMASGCSRMPSVFGAGSPAETARL